MLGGAGCIGVIASIMLPIVIVGVVLVAVFRAPITSVLSKFITSNGTALPPAIREVAKQSIEKVTPPPVLVQILGLDQKDGAPMTEPIVVSPDASAIYAVWDGNYPCLQRYETTTGSKTWERALKSAEFPFSLGSSSTTFYVSNTTIYGYSDSSSSGGTLVSFDAKSGAAKKNGS